MSERKREKRWKKRGMRKRERERVRRKREKEMRERYEENVFGKCKKQFFSYH